MVSAAVGGSVTAAGAAGGGATIAVGIGVTAARASSGADSGSCEQAATANASAHAAKARRATLLTGVRHHHNPESNTQQPRPQKPNALYPRRPLNVGRISGCDQGAQ